MIYSPIVVIWLSTTLYTMDGSLKLRFKKAKQPYKTKLIINYVQMYYEKIMHYYVVLYTLPLLEYF